MSTEQSLFGLEYDNINSTLSEFCCYEENVGCVLQEQNKESPVKDYGSEACEGAASSFRGDFDGKYCGYGALQSDHHHLAFNNRFQGLFFLKIYYLQVMILSWVSLKVGIS